MSSHKQTIFRICGILTIVLSISVFGFGMKPPIGAEVRYGFLSDAVLQLYNSSHERLHVTVVFTSRNRGDKCTRSYDIAPLSKFEIGALEAPWNFQAGETAVISVDGYVKKLYVKNCSDGKTYRTRYWYW